MNASGRLSVRTAVAGGVALLVLGSSAEALQPLATFVEAARTHDPDAHEAEAGIAGQDAQTELALARLTPNVSLRAGYTRNQYSVVLPLTLLDPAAPPTETLTLTPSNQLDVTFAIGVPLVDVASFWRVRASELGTDSAKHQLEATQLQIEAQVVQAYYQVIADLELRESSQRQLDVARSSSQLAHERVASGRAPALEQDRADALVEQQVQQLAQVQLLLDTATQALESLSGLRPEASGVVPAPSDDLHAEGAWEQFLPVGRPTPAMAAVVASRESARRQLDATWLNLLPIVTGSFNEHDGNYPGFSGHDAGWTAGLTLVWGLDATAWGALHAQRAQLAAAQARVDRVDQAVRDGVHNSWSAVRAAIARSRSARVQEQVTKHAVELAENRYEAGSSTQLDLLQAQRDAFAAEVARVQADADVVNARAQLRLAAGHDPLTSSGAAL